jgi:hypothetical protein
MLTFRALPVEKPHEIWPKMLCTRGSLVYDNAEVEHSYGSITFKEDYEWQLA